MIPAVAETSEASIDEIKFQLLIFLTLRNSQKNEKIGQKRIF